MASVESPDLTALQYSVRTVERADRAIRCSPFSLDLFTRMRSESVRLKSIVFEAGLTNRYTRSSLSELAAENYLLWLIQVGILRREVDGQGITDGFRLTPLGHRLVERYIAQGGWSEASVGDRFYNLINRWLGFFLPF
ncbi:MAG: hypothetical protein QNJ68_12400 [Microcoleaceae cyanobacterium MO_207.B10]|nr:hypothetical protein [Microcoleaceae cyanobacterium MO_207.B10]